MDREQANIVISRLFKLLPLNHVQVDEWEIHFGQSAWLDIWYGFHHPEITGEGEDSSFEFGNVTFLCDKKLPPDEIWLFRLGNCEKVLTGWHELDALVSG